MPSGAGPRTRVSISPFVSPASGPGREAATKVAHPSFQLTSPAAEGLFEKAIIQSAIDCGPCARRRVRAPGRRPHRIDTRDDRAVRPLAGPVRGRGSRCGRRRSAGMPGARRCASRLPARPPGRGPRRRECAVRPPGGRRSAAARVAFTPADSTSDNVVGGFRRLDHKYTERLSGQPGRREDAVTFGNGPAPDDEPVVLRTHLHRLDRLEQDVDTRLSVSHSGAVQKLAVADGERPDGEVVFGAEDLLPGDELAVLVEPCLDLHAYMIQPWPTFAIPPADGPSANV